MRLPTSRDLVHASLVVATVVALVVVPSIASAQPNHRSRAVARVRYIWHGLTIAPPHRSGRKGKVKQSLYSQYLLRTQNQQKASLGFNDGTVLHMNQQTNAVLRSPHVTYVQRGEVDQILVPGTNHQVQTGSAVATAIGTNFLVKVVHGGTYFICVHGMVLVKNKKGHQYVGKNQETVVVNGQAPQPPQHVNAQQAAAWTNGLPTPSLPENIGLGAGGARIVSFSSQYTSQIEGDRWDVKFINDGQLDRGWESASGSVTNQWVKVALPGNKTHTISEVLIDPAATAGDPSSADLNNFQIRVSTTGTSDASFTTVLAGTCAQKSSLQSFKLPAGTKAKYVELLGLNNHGSPDWLAVAEFEVIGK